MVSKLMNTISSDLKKLTCPYKNYNVALQRGKNAKSFERKKKV